MITRLITAVLPKRVFMNLCSLSSSREDTEVVIIYGLTLQLTLPFPAPLSDGLLFLFQSDPTSFYLESVSFIPKRPLDFERPYKGTWARSL